jgi:hypothetical protein
VKSTAFPALPSITYINSWRADRSDEEIKASNLANQKMKEERLREQAEAEEDPRPLQRWAGFRAWTWTPSRQGQGRARRRGQGRRRRGRTAKAVQAAAAK